MNACVQLRWTQGSTADAIKKGSVMARQTAGLKLLRNNQMRTTCNSSDSKRKRSEVFPVVMLTMRAYSLFTTELTGRYSENEILINKKKV